MNGGLEAHNIKEYIAKSLQVLQAQVDSIDILIALQNLDFLKCVNKYILLMYNYPTS